MPRNPSGKVEKQKLNKEERSQIAKDRWAKIRAKKEKEQPLTPTFDRQTERGLEQLDAAIEGSPIPPDLPPSSGRDENGVPSIVGLGDGAITSNGAFVPDQSDIVLSTSGVYRQNPDGSFTEIKRGIDAGQGLSPSAPIAPAPAPQLAPVRAPKPKRYTGPKEFSGALKAAEKRLAKAINERAEAMGKLAGLNAEIPSLLGIINALKGSQNAVTTISAMPLYDFPGQAPMSQQFLPPRNPMDALAAAQPAIPVSRALGNAVQFSPDVVGSLEGPEDDSDIDKFITGPAAGGGGWIGG